MQAIVHISNSQILNKGVVKTFFDDLLKKDGKHLLESKELTRRSTQQNSYLHLLCSMCVEPLRHAGWDNIRNTDDAKEFFKALK